MSCSAGVFQTPYCGLPFLPATSPVGFGPQFESATLFAQQNAQSVLAAVAGEVRNGYPTSSYVPLSHAVRLPPHLGVCCSSAGY